MTKVKERRRVNLDDDGLGPEVVEWSGDEQL